MKMLLTTVMALALAVTGAQGGLDWKSDSFGVYFDQAGNTNTTYPGIFTPYHVYLLVANPTAPVDGFECVVTRVGAPHFILSTDLGTGAVDDDPAADVFRVHSATPYPVAAGMIVLVHWQWMQQSTNPMAVFVGPTVPPALPGGLPVLRNGAALRLGDVYSQLPSLPVACVYSWCVDAEETTTFGTIKSLYR